MPPEINIVGKRFGKLVAIEKAKTINKDICYLCKCDCGESKIIRSKSLRTGESKSCGCSKGEMISKKHLADLAGKKFGMLTAINRIGVHKGTKKPTWICRCDCGNEKIIPSHSLMNGLAKSCGCNQYKLGKDNPRWKGGKQMNKFGYILIYDPENKKSNKTGYTLEHRYIMSQKMGRALLKNETVHHKNGNRSDNRIENLELWSHSHPFGQRVIDLLKFSEEIIKLYSKDKLKLK